MSSFDDESWNDQQWKELIESLINKGLLSWKNVVTLALGHMNPSQVGTSLASSEGFKRRYGKGNTMRIVMDWFYSQDGRCVDCGTRLELQADHNKPRESFQDPLEADFIENMVLRCRRCNVIKRPSHQFGGNTHLTAEFALMWIMFSFKPRTLHDFIRMCRLYGMTMADVRMQEGWAMAMWLQHIEGFDFPLDSPDKVCKLLIWNDGAITRAWEGDKIEGEYSCNQSLYNPEDHLCFVAGESLDENLVKITAYKVPITSLPFSHYFTDNGLRGNALAISYSAPLRGNDEVEPAKINDLPPRGLRLINYIIVNKDSNLTIQLNSRPYSLPAGSKRKKITEFRGAVDEVAVNFIVE